MYSAYYFPTISLPHLKYVNYWRKCHRYDTINVLKILYFEIVLMHYVEAFDRNQMMITSWDSMVEPESTARLIDAFVNSLNPADYGIKEMAS